ncbi:MAG: hypothetical protein ACFFDN_18385 [Candidatus Hodarchaeota archaeon]
MNRTASKQRDSLILFRPIFLTVVGLTFVSLVVCFYLSFKGELSTAQQQLFETCSTTWKMGFGAIVGLIGGRAFI